MKIFTRFLCSLLIALGLYTLPVNAQDTSTTTVTTETEEEDDSGLSPGGLFLEPFLNYQTAETNLRSSQVLPGLTSDTSGTNQGFGIGTRIGGHVWESIFLAADIRYARTVMDDSFYGQADVDNFDYGATLGVQTPWAGVRLWGTYIIGGFADPAEGDLGINARMRELTGYRVGAGVHLAAVSINLEYHDQEYGTTEVQSVGGIEALRSDLSMDADSRGYTLSLGFPLEL